MQTRARGPWHVLESRREEFRQDLDKHLGLVDAILDGRDWILGQPSLADFGIYGSISPLLTVGEMIPAEFPRLRRGALMIRKIGPGNRHSGLRSLKALLQVYEAPCPWFPASSRRTSSD